MVGASSPAGLGLVGVSADVNFLLATVFSKNWNG